MAPAATATVPPPVCDKMADAPTVKAGDLGSPDKPITIALVPSGDVPTITKAGTAIADCLSKLTGLKYNIEVGTNFAASIEAMGAGKAPFGFLNTFSAILAKEKYGVTPLLVSLRNYKGKPENFYQGQFITGKTTGIKAIADLKGKTFCFVDPNSTSGYIIPRIVLKANGIDPDKDLKGDDRTQARMTTSPSPCTRVTAMRVRRSSMFAPIPRPSKQTIPTWWIRWMSFTSPTISRMTVLQVAKGVDPAITVRR